MASQSEIATRLSGDNSHYRSVMNQSVRIAGETGKGLTKNLDLRDASRTMATAVGLNIQSIAENVARFITGISVETEETLKRIGELSDKVAAQSIANMRARLDEQDKYRMAVIEAGRAEDRMNANTQRTDEDRARFQEDNLKYLQLVGQIEATQRKKKEEAQKSDAEWSKQFLSENEKQHKEKMDAAQKEWDAFFDKKEKEEKAIKDLSALKKKDAFDAMNAEEQLANLQSQEIAIQKEIRKTKSEGLPTIEQETELYKLQKEIKEKILEVTNKQKTEEGAVAESIGFATNKLKSYVDEWTGFMVKVTTFGRGDKELSDRELDRKIKNIKADIAQREIASFMAQGNHFSGSGYDPFLDAQRSNLGQTQAELNFRERVRRTANTLGEGAAFNQFDGLSESRLREILGNNTEATKQTDLLQQLVDQQRKGIVTIPFGT